jgi:ribonuclease III
MSDRFEGACLAEQTTGYTFRDPSLLDAALTHASFTNESKDPLPDNERLEFLGDAVVSTAVAAMAFRLFPEAREGDMTRLKAAVVSEPALAERARALRLGECLRLGRGAALGDKVASMPSVLCNAFEALVGAIYLDGGFEAARAFVEEQLEPMLVRARDEGRASDAKSSLQVLCLKAAHAVPHYAVLAASGPSHAPAFTVQVTLFDGRAFTGTGRSKKEAEQAAAAAALEACHVPAHPARDPALP